MATPNTWSRGAYQCLCKRGYYSIRHPDGFNGTIMEIAWKEHQDNVSNYYSEVFICLQCAPGCDSCTGPEPCLADYNWPFRWVSGGDIKYKKDVIICFKFLLNLILEYLF